MKPRTIKLTKEEVLEILGEDKKPCPRCSKNGKKVYHYSKCPKENQVESHGILGFNPILLDE